MRRIYLLVLVFVVLLSIFLVYLILQKNADVVKKRKDVNLVLGESLTIPKLQAQLDQSKGDITQMHTAFPNRKNVAEIVSYIEQLGQSDSVSSSLTFGSDDIVLDSDNNPVVPITITAEGSLDNNEKFIKDLGSAPYYFLIDNVDIAAEHTDKTTIIIQGEVYVSQ